MTPEVPASPLRPVDATARDLARRLLRATPLATLATLDPADGGPAASLVTTATAVDGAPLLLLSSLALHRRALDADPRCSLLFVDPAPARGDRDPLTTARLTVFGRAHRIDEPTTADAARRRFLARHRHAARYVDFGDFAFFAVSIERASLNGGFARAYAMTAADLATPAPDVTAALAAREADAVAHMNADHADAVDRIATRLAGGRGGGWRMTGIDVDGFDLARGRTALRVAFDPPLASAESLRARLVALATLAREPDAT